MIAYTLALSEKFVVEMVLSGKLPETNLGLDYVPATI